MFKSEVRIATLTYCKQRLSENKNDIKNLEINLRKFKKKKNKCNPNCEKRN